MDGSTASFWHYEDGIEDARPIEIESVHIDRTGAGNYEGVMGRQQYRDQARRRVKKLFGPGRPVLVQMPEGGDRLPHWTVFAWLHSKELDRGDGSHLVLVFYVPRDALLGNTIRSLVFRAMKGLHWEDHARDWWY